MMIPHLGTQMWIVTAWRPWCEEGGPNECTSVPFFLDLCMFVKTIPVMFGFAHIR